MPHASVCVVADVLGETRDLNFCPSIVRNSQPFGRVTNCHCAGGARVNHRHISSSQAFLQFATGAPGCGKFRVGNDDDFRMNRVEQRVTKRFAFVRQTGDDNVGVQIIRVREQRALAVASQIGQQQNARAGKISEQHQRIVIRARKIIRRHRDATPASSRRVSPRLMNLVTRRRFFKFRDDFAISAGTETEPGWCTSSPMPKSSSSDSAPPMFRTSPCVKTRRGILFTPCARRNGLSVNFDGVVVAAIHQPVIFPSRRRPRKRHDRR